MDRDVDLIAEAGERFVDGVIDDFIGEMVQTCGAGRADVHRRPFANRFETFENLDLVGRIIVGGRSVAVAAGAGTRAVLAFLRIVGRLVVERLRTVGMVHVVLIFNRGARQTRIGMITYV